MNANKKKNNPITLNGEPLEKIDSFTYLGSTINKNGGTEEARIQKAKVWHSSCRETFGEQKQIKIKHQTDNIQFKCQGSFTLRIGDMANYTEDTKENIDLHQQMPAQNTTPEVDRQH